MFDKFTDRARHVLGLAREEAERRRQEYIEPAHILYGLVKEKYGVAAQTLLILKLEESKLLQILDGAWPARHPDTRTTGALPFTSSAKKLLEACWEKAQELGTFNYIGTEHLLLATAELEDALVKTIFQEANLTSAIITQEVRDLIGIKPELEKGSPANRVEKIVDRVLGDQKFQDTLAEWKTLSSRIQQNNLELYRAAQAAQLVAHYWFCKYQVSLIQNPLGENVRLKYAEELVKISQELEEQKIDPMAEMPEF